MLWIAFIQSVEVRSYSSNTQSRWLGSRSRHTESLLACHITGKDSPRIHQDSLRSRTEGAQRLTNSLMGRNWAATLHDPGEAFMAALGKTDGHAVREPLRRRCS